MDWQKDNEVLIRIDIPEVLNIFCDNVSIKFNAVVYFRAIESNKAIICENFIDRCGINSCAMWHRGATDSE